MKAFVSVSDFGSDQQKRNLCASLLAVAGVSAIINDALNVVFVCDVAELGGIMAKLSSDVSTNWIEYTLQFDA